MRGAARRDPHGAEEIAAPAGVVCGLAPGALNRSAARSSGLRTRLARGGETSSATVAAAWLPDVFAEHLRD